MATATHLTHLNLSGNHLVHLDPLVLAALPLLQHLDLSSNLLTSLEAEVLEEVTLHPALILLYLQGNPWACTSCHLAPLAAWLQSSLMYWGACFPPSSPSSLCLRCSSPPSLASTPISSLAPLPSCSSSSLPPDYMQASSSSLSSVGQYLGVALLAAVSLIASLIVLAKYRHYGVYRTGEEEDREVAVLTDPVQVLGTNSESYISLHYPGQWQGGSVDW